MVGMKGIRVIPESKERDRLHFAFMSNGISSERQVETAVRETAELLRRARGEVVCLDRDQAALRGPDYPAEALRVTGDCHAPPFADCSFDLVFFQNVLMWIPEPGEALGEATRVLEPGGAVVAVEPDYGGMMEHPPLGLRELWIDGLRAAGADPTAGRKLPALCEEAGLDVWVELAHLPQSARPEAVELLMDLLPGEAERERAREIEAQVCAPGGRWSPFIHLPYFLVAATRGGRA